MHEQLSLFVFLHSFLTFVWVPVMSSLMVVRTLTGNIDNYELLILLVKHLIKPK